MHNRLYDPRYEESSNFLILPLPALSMVQPQEYEYKPIMIDRNTGKITHIVELRDAGREDCLIGTHHRHDGPDYIKLYQDVTKEFYGNIYHGYFRMEDRGDGNYLVYDHGAHRGDLVKLDAEGRAIRNPVLRHPIKMEGKKRSPKSKKSCLKRHMKWVKSKRTSYCRKKNNRI